MNSNNKSQVLFNQLNFKQNDLNNNAQKLYSSSKQMSSVDLRNFKSDTNASLNSHVNIPFYTSSSTSSSPSSNSSSPSTSSSPDSYRSVESKFECTMSALNGCSNAQNLNNLNNLNNLKNLKNLNNLANLNCLNKNLSTFKIETMNHSGDANVDKNLNEIEIHRRLRNLINIVDVMKNRDSDEKVNANGQLQSKLDNNYRETNGNLEIDEKIAKIKSTHSSSQITNEVQNELLILDETDSYCHSMLANMTNGLSNLERKLNSLSDPRTTTKDQSSAHKNSQSNHKQESPLNFVSSLGEQRSNRIRAEEATKQYKNDAQSTNLMLSKNMNIQVNDENKFDEKINRTSLNNLIDTNQIVDSNLDESKKFDSEHELECKSILNNNEKSIDTSNLKTRSKLNELRINENLNYEPESKAHDCGNSVNNTNGTSNTGSKSRLPPPRSVNTSGDLYVVKTGQNVVYSSIGYNSCENQLNKHNSLFNLNKRSIDIDDRSRYGKQANNFEQNQLDCKKENNNLVNVRSNALANTEALSACASNNFSLASVKVSKQEQTELSHQLLLAKIESNMIQTPVCAGTNVKRGIESSNVKSTYETDEMNEEIANGPNGQRCANKGKV